MRSSSILYLGVQNELRSNGAGSGGSAFLDYCTERRVCAFSRIVTEKSPSFSIDGLTEFCCAGGPKLHLRASEVGCCGAAAHVRVRHLVPACEKACAQSYTHTHTSPGFRPMSLARRSYISIGDIRVWFGLFVFIRYS